VRGVLIVVLYCAVLYLELVKNSTRVFMLWCTIHTKCAKRSQRIEGWP
jgi:hypothetical protein